MIPKKAGRLSEHFKLSEFTKSNKALENGINNTPPENAIYNLQALCNNVLEPIRQYFNCPVIITSGFRSKKLNQTIGGSKYSQHLKGEASDFIVKGVKTSDIFAFLTNTKKWTSGQIHTPARTDHREAGGEYSKDHEKWLTSQSISFDQVIYEKRGKSEWIHISHKRNRREKLIATFENGKPNYRRVS